MLGRFDFDQLSVRQILIISGVLYAACLPIFAYAQWSYVPPRVPKGERVEQIQGFVPTPEGRYMARTFQFVREPHVENGTIVYKDFTRPMPLVVYEDDAKMSEANYQIQKLTPLDVWRHVWIKPSDGSDPRRNGRSYYVVLR